MKLIVTLCDLSVVTLSLRTTDIADAKRAAEQLAAGRGFWDDNDEWHTAQAIVTVKIA